MQTVCAHACPCMPLHAPARACSAHALAHACTCMRRWQEAHAAGNGDAPATSCSRLSAWATRRIAARCFLRASLGAALRRFLAMRLILWRMRASTVSATSTPMASSETWPCAATVCKEQQQGISMCRATLCICMHVCMHAGACRGALHANPADSSRIEHAYVWRRVLNRRLSLRSPSAPWPRSWVRVRFRST